MFALKVHCVYTLRNKANFHVETNGRGKTLSMPAQTLGGLPFTEQLLPKPGLLVVCNKYNTIRNQTPRGPVV